MGFFYSIFSCAILHAIKNSIKLFFSVKFLVVLYLGLIFPGLATDAGFCFIRVTAQKTSYILQIITLLCENE